MLIGYAFIIAAGLMILGIARDPQDALKIAGNIIGFLILAAIVGVILLIINYS